MAPWSPLSRAENLAPLTELGDNPQAADTQEADAFLGGQGEANAQLIRAWWRPPLSWGHGHSPSTALHCPR